MKNREYFRVKDVLPVVTRKVDLEEWPGVRSRIIPGSSIYPNASLEPFDDPGNDIPPRLSHILCEMNAKLDLILEKSAIESEGFDKAKKMEIDISEGGIRLHVNEKYLVGDLVEVKLLLSRLPLLGLIVYGKVTRVMEVGQQEYEMGVAFLGIENDVRETLWQYILNRQRATLQIQLEKDS